MDSTKKLKPTFCLNIFFNSSSIITSSKRFFNYSYQTQLYIYVVFLFSFPFNKRNKNNHECYVILF